MDSRNLRLQAWHRQESCLSAPQYRVTVVDRDTERVRELNRRWNMKHPEKPRSEDEPHVINLCKKPGEAEILWTAADVVKNFGTLEYRNANQYDVYVTPIDSSFHHLLLDDLTASGVNYIKARYSPCLAQTSSRDNYQAIIRVPKLEISPAEQSAANFLLQRLNRLPDGCGGDRGISGTIHPFRVCGFQNKKTGRGDFLTKIELYRPGAVRPVATAGLEECREAIRVRPSHKQAEKTSEVVEKTDFGPVTPLDEVFLREWRKQSAWSTALVFRGVYPNRDDSTIDYRTCKKLLNQGFTPEELAGPFARCSPRVAERHPNLSSYIRGTLDAALSDEPEVDL